MKRICERLYKFTEIKFLQIQLGITCITWDPFRQGFLKSQTNLSYCLIFIE